MEITRLQGIILRKKILTVVHDTNEVYDPMNKNCFEAMLCVLLMQSFKKIKLKFVYKYCNNVYLKFTSGVHSRSNTHIILKYV